jgi:hypothetical protein
MKLTNTLLVLGLAALPASALALDGDGKAGEGKNDDAAALVQKLGDKDYKVRRDAYKQLEKLGGDARGALESAAKSDDAEVRWNASRLLDHLDAADTKSTQGGLKERVDPQSNDGQDDDAQDGTGRTRGWRSRGGPVDLQQQLRDLEFHMQELQKFFDQDGFGGFDAFRNGGPLGLGWAQRFGQIDQSGEMPLQPGSSFSRTSTSDGKTESFSLRVDANGHVTAEEQKDGKTTKVEADSIEAFKKEHPEMLRRGPVSFSIHPFGQNGMQAKGQGVTIVPATPEPPQPNAQTVNPKRRNKLKAPKAETVETLPGQDVAPAPKPRLGVELAPVPQDVAEYLELDGDAFQIVRVMDDMPAARRGLKARDILLEVNGQAVHGFDDVVKALDGADPNAVKIVVLRRGQRKEL